MDARVCHHDPARITDQPRSYLTELLFYKVELATIWRSKPAFKHFLSPVLNRCLDCIISCYSASTAQAGYSKTQPVGIASTGHLFEQCFDIAGFALRIYDLD